MPSRVAFVLLALVASFAMGQDVLPTPYSAEQIRDAWTQGMTLVTKTWTPEGETQSRTTVTAWAEDSVSMIDQPLDANGVPTGEPTTYESTWTALRDHARFPTSSAKRERAMRDTPLGTLDGWLYTLEHGENDHSEFFFADAYPGSPVVFERTTNEKLLMRAETIEHGTAEPAAP